MAVTRLPKGLSTAAKDSTLWNYVYPDPTKNITFWDDFYQYDASHWVVTTTETGTATEAIQNEVGGVLKLTNGTADNDVDTLQWSGEEDADGVEFFKLSASGKSWFKARFKVSDATQSDFIIGLSSIDTTPFTIGASDTVRFKSDDGDANLDFTIRSNSDTSSVFTPHTMEDDTYVTVGWYYDKSEFIIYVNDVHVSTLNPTTFPSGLMTPTFGIRNGAAAAKSMSIDYILAAQERP